MAVMPLPTPRLTLDRTRRRDRQHADSLARRLPMTSAEIEQLTALFEPELRRGWIPRESDLRDALGALRAQSRPA